MWHLVKAELEYHKFSIVFALLLITGIINAALAWGWESAGRDIPGLTKIMAVVTLVLWFLRLIRLFKEKTERFHTILPVSGRKICLARNMFAPLIWLAMVAMFLLALIIIRPASIPAWTFWYLLSITGVVFAINAYPLLHHDLTFWLREKYQKLILTLISAAVILSTALLISTSAIQRYFPLAPLQPLMPLTTQMAEVNATPAGACLLLSLGLSLTYVDILVFQRRKHYLD